jgi:hypothetical protein
MIKLTDKEVDVLIGEYQACHRNRNHYDSVGWTIGSIFIAVSLALIGFSFTLEFSRDLYHWSRSGIIISPSRKDGNKVEESEYGIFRNDASVNLC